MTRDQQAPWFPAKRYGWGWGPPATWQGWVVLALYLTLQSLCTIIFLRDQQIIAFVAGTVALTAMLIVTCWIKGEHPGWRWGNE